MQDENEDVEGDDGSEEGNARCCKQISPQKWKPWIVKEQQNLHAAISSNLDQFAHDKFSRLGPQMNPFLLVPVLCQKQHVSTVAGN